MTIIKSNTVISLIFTVLFFASTVQAQYGGRRSFSRSSNKFSAGISVGQLQYYGDIGPDKDLKISSPTKRLGYQFNLDQRFGEMSRYSNMFGLQLHVLYGQISEEDKKSNGRHLNFETDLLQFELHGVLHFERLLNLHRRSRVSPYITIGFSFIEFTPRGDLYHDETNKLYYYWTDGTTRDIPYEDVVNPETDGFILERDHIYETELDPEKTYKHQAFAVPLGVGIEYDLTHRIKVKIAYKAYICFSDDLDNKNNPGLENVYNDMYTYTSAGLLYNLTKVSSKYRRKRYKSKF